MKKDAIETEVCLVEAWPTRHCIVALFGSGKRYQLVSLGFWGCPNRAHSNIGSAHGCNYSKHLAHPNISWDHVGGRDFVRPGCSFFEFT